MTAIHLVYPHDARRISAPWSIGNHLAWGLMRAGLEVHQYDWEDPRVLAGDGGVLLGHPHPEPGRVFSSSLAGNWRRRVAMTPWGGLQTTVAMIDAILPQIDAVLLICGPYWRARVPAHWAGKARCLDMAIHRTDYPAIKREFAPAGERSFVTVGCTVHGKGAGWLSQLAGMVR